MRLRNLSRLVFAAAIIVAGLVMASCAVPVAPDQPPSQPPITVVIVVTAVQPAEVTATVTSKPVVIEVTPTPTSKAVVVEPTATSTGKPPPVQSTATSTSKPSTAQPTATATGKPPIVSPTSTSTSKPPIVSPTSTAASKPPTATVTRTLAPTSTRTRTVTPTRTATPPPHTRTLYSDRELVRFGWPPIVTGGKGDTVVLNGRLLPPGCEIVDLKALDFHLPHEIQLPPVATARHMNTPVTGHGWTVERSSTNPRDLGARVHWWYDAGNMLDMRLVYTVREPWDVDCNVLGLTQLEP